MTFPPWGRTTTARQLARWVAQNAPQRIAGAVFVVTGGYGGIGLRCVWALSRYGAQVVVPARDVAGARRAIGDWPGVQLQPMDLMDPDSIARFVDWFTASHRSLDGLIGCAGIMAPPLRRDARGHESQFSTNHLGHFQLAVGLSGCLAASAVHPRLVLVSSRAQRAAGNLTGQARCGADGALHAGDDAGQDGPAAGIHFDDPDWLLTPYQPMLAYAQSKTANVLTAVEFDRRWRHQPVRAFAVHPGLVPGTALGRHNPAPRLTRIAAGTRLGVAALNAGRRLAGQVHGPGDLFKTPGQAAGAVLWTALSPQLDEQGGVYCEDCHIAPVVTDPHAPSGVLPWAVDPAKAQRLWLLSEQMIWGKAGANGSGISEVEE